MYCKLYKSTKIQKTQMYQLKLDVALAKCQWATIQNKY